MSPPQWTADHGTLLKSLRQQAELDVATLARKHMLSGTQVVQLEEGGDSAFYNPDIKFATGRRLLQALGHDLPEQASTRRLTTFTIQEKTQIQGGEPRSSISWAPQYIAWPLLALLIAMGFLGLYVENAPNEITAEPVPPANTTAPDTAAVPAPRN